MVKTFDPEPSQTVAPMDFLSLLTPNQLAFVQSVMRSVAADAKVRTPTDALRALRVQLHLRVVRAWAEAESSAFSVTISLTVSMEAAALEYAQNCLNTYRARTSGQKRRRAA